MPPGKLSRVIVDVLKCHSALFLIMLLAEGNADSIIKNNAACLYTCDISMLTIIDYSRYFYYRNTREKTSELILILIN